MGIRRYTTPTKRLLVENEDLTGAEVYVTFKQGKYGYTFKEDEISKEFDGIDTIVYVRFTQENSANFKANKTAEVEINWMIGEDRFATEIAEVDISRNLMEEVIDNG